MGLCLEIVLKTLELIKEQQRKKEQARQAQEQRQRLETWISTDVAPKVAHDLRTTVSSNYAKIAAGEIERLRQLLGARVAGVEKDINKSRDEIQAQQHTADERKHDLRTAIDALTKARQPLEVPA